MSRGDTDSWGENVAAVSINGKRGGQMKAARIAGILVGICLLAPIATFAQTGPEEQALLEMFFAEKASVVEAHLPDVVQNAVRELAPADRAELESVLLVRESAPPAVKFSLPVDGRALLVIESNGEEQKKEIEVRLRRKLTDGLESVLQLEGVQAGISQGTLQVWMKLEGGVWRLTELAVVGDQVITFDEAFVKRFRGRKQLGNEASAVDNVRTLNTALVTYAAVYPEIGFPVTLDALGGDGGSASHAGLIDSVLASGVKAGYKFEYSGGGTTYNIVARPVASDVTGKRAFFTDQSGVIRFTQENRIPTAEDPPLQ
jgi:hypothetical protein